MVDKSTTQFWGPILPAANGDLYSSAPGGSPDPTNPPVWSEVPNYLAQTSALSVNVFTTFLTPTSGLTAVLNGAGVNGSTLPAGWSWNGTIFAYNGTSVNASPLTGLSFTATSIASGLHSTSNTFSIQGVSPTVGLMVSGNKIIAAATLAQVNLVGAAMVPGYPASMSALAQITTAQIQTAIANALATVGTAAKPYCNINMIRIPIVSCAWMGYQGLLPFGVPDNAPSTYNGFQLISGSGSTGIYAWGISAAAYQANILAMVNAYTAAGLAVLIDMHWGTPQRADGQAYISVGQTCMESPLDVACWTSIANTFKNKPFVMFELFNEPFYLNPTGISNANFLLCTGPVGVGALANSPVGTTLAPFCVNDNDGDGTYKNLDGGAAFNIIGHQQCINAIRLTGATNIIWASTPNFTQEPACFTRMNLTDPLNQLGMTYHGYGLVGYNGASGSLADFNAVAAAGYPILCTEMGSLTASGSSTPYSYFRSQGWGYTWWEGSNPGQWNNNGNYPTQYSTAPLPTIQSTQPWKFNGAATPSGTN